MKNSILLFSLLLIFACNQSSKTEKLASRMVDNEELKKIYEEDQTDRQTGNIDWSIVSKRDSIRQARVYELLDLNKVNTSVDFSNAALIFQHGGDTIASSMAVKLMRKAIELDSTADKWLLAAAIDRDLMRKGKPQIFGTQFRRMNNGPWELYNLDTTKVSDTKRKEYRVETLAEQREKLIMMNKEKLSDLLSSGKDIDEIIEFCQTQNLKSSNYDLSERGINTFGYQLMSQDKNEAALKIFELNTKLYPASFNTYDSYGECLVKIGEIEEGIKAYEKALELNPENKNAEIVLTKLKKG